MIHSEWITLRSRRSSVVLIALSIAVMVAVSALSAIGLMVSYEGPSELVNAQSVQGLPTVGLYPGQLVLAALGVLIVTSGRGTRMTRSTLPAEPRSVPVFLARGILAGIIGGVVGVVGRFASYLAIQPILAQNGLDFALGSTEFWSSLAGAGLYFALISVMAVGIGSLVRSSAAGIATTTGLLFLAPMVLWLAPGEVPANLVNFLPSEAGTQLMLAEVAPGDLTQLQGALILAVWALAPFAAGLLRAKRSAS